MGTLNRLIAGIRDTENIIRRIKSEKNPLKASENKAALDSLVSRLARYQQDLNGLGIKHSIIRVDTMGGQRYFTGITEIEAKEIMAYRYPNEVTIQYTELIPGKIIKKK